MRKIFFIFIFSGLVYLADGRGQGNYVSVDNRVYDFLERMEAERIITDYHSESLPLSRKTVADFLLRIRDKRDELSEIDKSFLEYYLIEFGFEAFGNIDRYQSLFGQGDFDLLSNKEKFLYAYYDDKFSIFVKSFLFERVNGNRNSAIKNTAVLSEVGGRIYGSITKYIGFEIEGKNGFLKGDKSAAYVEDELIYNFKLNEKPESNFFDRAYGYIAFEHPNLQIKVGSDRQLQGYGINKLILGNFSPNFNYVNLKINYKSLEFAYTHGWLLGSKNVSLDPVEGTINQVTPKYYVHHRLAFSPFDYFRIGFGETVIYSRRNVDLAYLNPFNFYKSTEHSLQDRDNALLYTDMEFLPFPKVRFYSTLLIDDVDFSKLGSGWFGNQFGINFGLNLYSPIDYFPLHFGFEYTRLEPYIFTHRINENNYSNYNYALGPELQPNSDQISIQLNYFPNPKLNLTLLINYTRHGSNKIKNGEIINYGGDLYLGKRTFDSEYVKFLGGDLEKKIGVEINGYYEFIRNIKAIGKIKYEKTQKISTDESILIFSIGLISFL